jgi:hypothetical protein
MRTVAKVPATASAKQAKRIATTVGIFAPAGVEIDLVRINPRVLPGVRIAACREPSCFLGFAMVCDHLRYGWRGAIAYRTAFVHPSIDLTPKIVDEQRRFARFAIRISRLRNSGLDFSARLILLYERLICHGSPLHDHR